MRTTIIDKNLQNMKAKHEGFRYGQGHNNYRK